MKIYSSEIIFKSHEPFQSYQLTGPEGLVRLGQLADNSERACGIWK